MLLTARAGIEEELARWKRFLELPEDVSERNPSSSTEDETQAKVMIQNPLCTLHTALWEEQEAAGTTKRSHIWW